MFIFRKEYKKYSLVQQIVYLEIKTFFFPGKKMYYFVFCFSVFGVSLDRSYYVPLKFISAVGLLSPRTQQLHSRSGYDSLLNHV